MQQSRTVAAVAVWTEPARLWAAGIAQGAGEVFGRVTGWAADTAQQFGSVLAALMGPAVLSGYAFAAWSLADNLGWTDTFVVRHGALSNWLIWFIIAGLINLAASILKRRTETEKSQ